MIITIDGPAGAGKTTVAKILAMRLGLKCVDTGATYRALTYWAMKNGIPFEELPDRMDGFSLSLRHGRIYVDGEDVGDRIRTPQVSAAVSKVAAIPEVRQKMVLIQRRISGKNAVVEGRDAGTVIFPEADYKFFLDAELRERTRRRHAEFVSRGIDVSFGEVMRNIKLRDEKDLTRKYGPLEIPMDAYYIDTTNYSVEEVVEMIEKIVVSKISPYPLWYVGWVLARAFFSFFPLKVHGGENLPKRGCILAANHRSFLDPPVVGASLKRPIFSMARSSLFDYSLFKPLIKSVGAFPVRKGVYIDRVALQKGVFILERGGAVLIFPEGTRSLDFRRPSHGLGYLVLSSGAPVVPTLIVGTDKALPRRGKFRFHKIEVIFGEPLHFPRKKFFNRREALRVSETVMNTVKRMFDDYKNS